MKYAQQHLLVAIDLITNYDGRLPLSIYLKKYFAANKKYGSKDRKQIAHFCFVYYRCANAFRGLLLDEKVKAALFICNDSIDDIAILFDSNWITNWQPLLLNRCAFVQTIFQNFKPEHIFPSVNELSEGIDAAVFAASHTTQPDLFLRIRPNKKDTVIKKLAAANIAFIQVTNTCLALLNNSKIDAVLEVDTEVVVQDYSSQLIAEFLSFLLSTINYQPSTFSVWDCCAASGGKSILVKDMLGNIQLTVSDVRASIIQNLQARFAKAGITSYESFVADVSNSNYQLPTTNYQLIICDAPCTGSGTWGRTPEQLSFFKQKDIEKYTNLQQQIVANTLLHLAENGYFLYITCSVFKQENEAMVGFIQQQNPLLELVKQELLIGYTKKADTMFAALFHLPKSS